MSATTKAHGQSHGLDGSLVEPDWPALNLAELRSLLAKFPDLGEATRILSVSPRPFSAAGVVAVRNERGTERPVFIKRHQPDEALFPVISSASEREPAAPGETCPESCGRNGLVFVWEHSAAFYDLTISTHYDN